MAVAFITSESESNEEGFDGFRSVHMISLTFRKKCTGLPNSTHTGEYNEHHIRHEKSKKSKIMIAGP